MYNALCRGGTTLQLSDLSTAIWLLSTNRAAFAMPLGGVCHAASAPAAQSPLRGSLRRTADAATLIPPLRSHCRAIEY